MTIPNHLYDCIHAWHEVMRYHTWSSGTVQIDAKPPEGCPVTIVYECLYCRERTERVVDPGKGE